MSSDIRVQVQMRDFPDPPMLNVLAVDDHKRTVISAWAPLKAPHSVAQIRRAVDMILLAWFEPELGQRAEDNVHDIFAAVTDPA